MTVRQAERIAAYDWSRVCALGKDVVVTGDIINARYSKWIYNGLAGDAVVDPTAGIDGARGGHAQ
jgi:hypothetical protein